MLADLATISRETSVPSHTLTHTSQHVVIAVAIIWFSSVAYAASLSRHRT